MAATLGVALKVLAPEIALEALAEAHGDALRALAATLGVALGASAAELKA
jgi:hypothetical protein